MISIFSAPIITKKWIYYNDHDPAVLAWASELIKKGLVPDGEVDGRSILDVSPDDVREFTQCHFFCGILGWSLALRLAGWPDDRPVWTGSPPCQPFSSAGRQLGKDDSRHLAPHFIDLVRACRPRVLFGEQVASSDVFGKAAKRARGKPIAPPQWAWLDDLSDRLEAARYAVGASDFPSAGVGAPHIRQRTYFGAINIEWLSDTASIRRFGRGPGETGAEPGSQQRPDGFCDAGGMVHGIGARLEGHSGHGDGSHEPGRIDQDAPGSVAEAGADGGVADAHGRDARAEGLQRSGEQRQQPKNGGNADRDRGSGPIHSFWSDPDWLFCRDGKLRPVESTVLGLAARVPAELVRSGAFVPASYPLSKGGKDSRRVMRLRGYGNAINPWAAKEFIQAFAGVIDDQA